MRRRLHLLRIDHRRSECEASGAFLACPEFEVHRRIAANSAMISRTLPCVRLAGARRTGVGAAAAPTLVTVLLWILLLALLPASVRADAGREAPDCEEDPTLSRAAAELLIRAEPPGAAAVRRALLEVGSDAVGVRAYLTQGAEAKASRWLAQFKRAADAPAVCGFARSERAQLLLAVARAGSLDPLRDRQAVVRGRVVDGFRDPEIVVEDGEGNLQRYAVDRAQLARGIPISDQLARPVRVQLLARGSAGPRPIAERMLPGASEANTGDHDATVAGPQLPAAARLAALRRQNRLPAVRDNRLLAGVAAEHARQVCDGGRVAHELEPGADPEQRLRRAGISARLVGETVARASSVDAAFGAFERSPSHRLTLLERSFTDAGIGEVTDTHGRRCVVVLLAAWPRYLGR
jgi:uncharacterized protein YkwD